MIQSGKVDFRYMNRNELVDLAKEGLKELQEKAHLGIVVNISTIKGLEAVEKHLQRYSFNDVEVIQIRDTIKALSSTGLDRQDNKFSKVIPKGNYYKTNGFLKSNR